MISEEANRALSAVLCLTPYTPMLFMGQEWNATTPFTFFCDHRAGLGQLITAGRREEFKAFKAFQDPASRDQIPDPQSAETFEASKLRWEEAAAAPHAGMLALYRECLALRHAENAFRPEDRETWQVAETSFGAGALRFASESGCWLLLFDLVGGHAGALSSDPICVPPDGDSWSLVLYSNASRFGGNGQCVIDPAFSFANFERPETILLRAQAML